MQNYWAFRTLSSILIVNPIFKNKISFSYCGMKIHNVYFIKSIKSMTTKFMPHEILHEQRKEFIKLAN